MAKEKEIAVSKIVLQIGAREIALTLGEARQLKSALDELFKVEQHWHYPVYPYIPAKPWYTLTTFPDSGVTITCDVSSASNLITLGDTNAS